MTYDEFKRQLGKAGLSVKSFAQLIKQHPNSITNYAAQGTIPTHLAIISVLMGYIADQGLDYRAALEQADFGEARRHSSTNKGEFSDIKDAD